MRHLTSKQAWPVPGNSPTTLHHRNLLDLAVSAMLPMQLGIHYAYCIPARRCPTTSQQSLHRFQWCRDMSLFVSAECAIPWALPCSGRALLKKHRQKRDRKRYKKKPKRDTMPNQHRKQLTLAKEHTSCALAIPQLPPETPPPQQTGTNPDVSPKKSDVSGSAPFASTCTRPKEDSP